MLSEPGDLVLLKEVELEPLPETIHARQCPGGLFCPGSTPCLAGSASPDVIGYAGPLPSLSGTVLGTLCSTLDLS